MAKALNFDAVVVETIAVTKHGQTWQLRDDVPMRTLVRTFALIEKQQELAGAKGVTSQQADEWLGELQDMTTRLLGEIWRHTPDYASIADEELAARFSFEEQLQLVMLFFTTRSQQLQQPANARSASLPTKSQSTMSPQQPASQSDRSSVTANRQRARGRTPGAAGGTSRRRS